MLLALAVAIFSLLNLQQYTQHFSGLSLGQCSDQCELSHLIVIAMNKFHAGWYLIYTKPRHEKKVYAHLTEIQINSFLPTKKTLRNWHDRKKYVDEPLFPSYVFIYLNDMKNYYDGMDTDGALYYVRIGKELARVGESVIDNIKLAASQGTGIEVSDDHFQPGRQLVINQGALTGLSCEVVQWHSKHRLLVRVDLLKRNILLTLPEEHLMVI